MLAGVASPASSDPTGTRGADPAVVKVVDFDFRPDRLVLRSGQRVDFRWAPRNATPHNVTLREAPRGVRLRQFQSETGVTRVEFEPVFDRPGDYHFLCTIHPDVMRLEVEVKR